MAGTDIAFCSQALILLGASPINSFEDETDTSLICANTYPDFKKYVLAVYPWRFTMTKAELTRDAVAPVNEWLYAYTLPADRLENGAWAVFDTATAGALPVKRWEIFENKLYCDYERVWVDYQREISEAKWPSTFTQFALAAYRAQIAFAVTDQQSTAEKWNLDAWGLPSDDRQGGLFKTAANSDALRNPPPEMDADDLIAVRGY